MKYFLTSILFVSLALTTEPVFGEQQDWGVIEENDIDEASGIVASQKNENVFWTHNDSGGDNCVYAFNNSGIHLGRYYLDNISLRDWEDMSTGPGPIQDSIYLYIGEIGDNGAQYNNKYIYRFIEPNVLENQNPVTETIANVETIAFIYPDQRRDAETLMVDPLTKDIYIVSKREEFVTIYRLPYPQSTTETMTAEIIATIDLYPTEDNDGEQASWITAGEISANGLEILLKSYVNIFHFSRTEEQTIGDALSNIPFPVSYVLESQGEAVAWHPQGFGYFTVSEENYGIDARLYFYPRTVGCMNENANNFNPWANEDDGSCEFSTLIGDVNFDGTIDLLDVSLIVNYILEFENNIDNADMDNDGLVNIVDLVMLLALF